MLRRSRVASAAPDMARIAEAISRPGIDPRVWVSIAIIRKVVVEPTEGVFAEVTLLPSQTKATARLGAIYEGPGFGLYAPLEKDDEVVIVAPSGNPAEGLVVVSRLWSASDPPPQAVVDNPLDVVLVTKPDVSLRILVAGKGTVQIVCEDVVSVTAKEVHLNGDADAAALASKVSARVDALQQALDTHTHPVATTGSASAQTGTAAPTTDLVGPLEPVASATVKVGS